MLLLGLQMWLRLCQLDTSMWDLQGENECLKSILFFCFGYFCCKPRLKELKLSLSAVAETLVPSLKFCDSPVRGWNTVLLVWIVVEMMGLWSWELQEWFPWVTQQLLMLCFLLVGRAEVLLAVQFVSVIWGIILDAQIRAYFISSTGHFVEYNKSFFCFNLQECIKSKEKFSETDFEW